MSLQSERLLSNMQRLRLSHLPSCYESLAEEAAAKDLPCLDPKTSTLPKLRNFQAPEFEDYSSAVDS